MSLRGNPKLESRKLPRNTDSHHAVILPIALVGIDQFNKAFTAVSHDCNR
jgi:hypothetical protein